MNHPLFAEALVRAAARRGWLDRHEIVRLTSMLRGGADQRCGQARMAARLGDE